MSGRKKTFPCTHTGKGQYCHFCAQKEKAKSEAERVKAERKRRMASSPIPLHRLPEEIVDRVLDVIEGIDVGKPLSDFEAKRLTKMNQRHVIVISIGNSHRLICCDRGSWRFLEALTHEEYNNRLAAGGWKC